MSTSKNLFKDLVDQVKSQVVGEIKTEETEDIAVGGSQEGSRGTQGQSSHLEDRSRLTSWTSIESLDLDLKSEKRVESGHSHQHSQQDLQRKSLKEEDMDSLQVLHLKANNFSRWKFEMTCLLESKEVMEIVDGSSTLPTERDNEAAIKEWKKGDALAKTIISKSLDNQHHAYIRSCTTSKEMWDTIKNLKEQKSSTNILIATQEFHAYQWEPHHDVSAFMSGLFSLNQTLESLGKKVDETQMIGKIIFCLPEKFSSFKMMWNMTKGSDAKLSDLQSLLLSAEAELTVTQGNSSSGDAFFNGKRNGRSNNNRSSGSNTSHGHPGRGRRQFQQKSQGPSKGECFGCGEEGHFLRDCPKAKKTQGSDKNNNSHGGKNGKSGFVVKQYPQAHPHFHPLPRVDDGWICDSGSFAHITRNKEWFCELEEQTPESIYVGNGKKVYATHIGRIPVEVFNGTQWQDTFLNDVRYCPDFGDTSLFSVSSARKRGYKVTFEDHVVLTSKETGQVDLVGYLDGHLYTLCMRIKKEALVADNTTSTSTYTRIPEIEVNDSPSLTEVSRVDDVDVTPSCQGKGYLWHLRFGHISVNKIRMMQKNGLVEGLEDNIEDDFFCDGCCLGRITKSPTGTPRVRESRVGHSIHSDIGGPLPVESIGRNKYFVVFKDEASCFRKVYFFREKNQVLSCFKKYLNEMQAKTEWKVCKFRSDNGTEFVGQDFKDFLIHRGIHYETSPAYRPQLNGIAEREMRTHQELGLSMIHSSDLPQFLWAEAINTACYLMNRVPNRKSTTTTPFEMWFGRKPSVSHLRIFGTTAFIPVPGVKRKKLDKRGERVVFVGYGESDKLFRIYSPERRVVEIVNDIRFDEILPEKLVFSRVNNNFVSKHKQEGVSPGIDSISSLDDDDEESSEDSHPQEELSTQALTEDALEDLLPQSSSSVSGDGNVSFRFSTPQRSTSSSSSQVIDTAESEGEELTLGPIKRGRGRPKGSKSNSKPYPSSDRVLRERKQALTVSSDPIDRRDALSRPDKNEWIKSMDEEMEALKKNKTWVLVPLPQGRKTVSCKWVLRTKVKPDGSLDRYKGRLVARGFSQTHGVDYHETYSPVVRYESIRTILSLAASTDMEICQFDVKTAFLYGDLHEEVYMTQPEGYEDGTDNVCLLKKSLYGLKQAPRQWNIKFHTFLVSFGLVRSEADQSVYFSSSKSSTIILALYVDDGLLCCSPRDLMHRLLKELETQFEVKVDDPQVFVGLEIKRQRDKRLITINQQGYIGRILARFNMSDCKSCVTPGESTVKLTKSMKDVDDCGDSKEDMTNIPYREAVGSLMFLMHCSRPDIAFEVTKVAQFCENPQPPHWKRVKRIMRYLKGTQDYALHFGCKINDLSLTAYCDSDWAGDPETRRSTSGFLVMFGRGPVSWNTRQQKTVALSSTEAEYMSAVEVVKEIKWMKQLLTDIGQRQLASTTTCIFCDNQGAICLSKSPNFHGRTKHIDVKHHFIRQEQEDGVISIDYISTNHQPSDMMTKSLVSSKLLKCCNDIGLRGTITSKKEC